MAIKKELEAGPKRIRALSREELKIEVRKYKNISLKIIQEFQNMGQKVPGYAATLAKQGLGSGEGLKEERSQKSNMDGESMFE